MARYEVVTPWFGVERGAVIETVKLHPAILPNVKPVEETKVELVVATPKVEVGVDGVSAEELTAAVKREVKRGRKPKDQEAA